MLAGWRRPHVDRASSTCTGKRKEFIMKVFGNKSMRWAVRTIGLTLLVLALAPPQAEGFGFKGDSTKEKADSAETVADYAKSAAESIKSATSAKESADSAQKVADSAQTAAGSVKSATATKDSATEYAKNTAAAAKDAAAELSGGSIGETVKNVAGAARAMVMGEDDEVVPGATVEILTDENFERVTQVSTGATTGDWFVKFYAPWCGHCRKLEPTWEELAAKLGGVTNVGRVDVTANKDLGKRFGIKSFPTLLLFSHGNVYKYSGPRKVDNLMAFAKGEFKDAGSQPVPSPTSFWSQLKGLFGNVAHDVKGIKDGKMPSRTTFLLFAAGLITVMLALALAMPSARPKAVRPKAD